MKHKILLLSAYRSDSHAYWADWLQQEIGAEQRVEWRVLELPGRYFRWRIRGNPLSWLNELTELLQHWQPSRILATSMVDISTIRGLFPALAQLPLDYYFHENQFAYPTGEGQHLSLDPQMVQLYGALAADRIWFNSHFNQQSFLAGVEQLMKKLPDQVPAALAAQLQQKCGWLPVPVRAIPTSAVAKTQNLIVWNHRWEYDKNPQFFQQILRQLKQHQVDFSLALLGHRAPKTPDVLKQIEDEFGAHILVNGRVSKADYQYWLNQAQVVVSSANHEFQGLSMLEASSAGAIPVVPDDLCYQEQYPLSHRYTPGNVNEAVVRVRAALSAQLPVCDVSNWLADQVKPRWIEVLNR